MLEYIPFLKSIIDLLVIKREDKKRSLELKKLKNESADKNRLIQPATIADIEKYDVKYQKIKNGLNMTG
jgi:hypothetical protein